MLPKFLYLPNLVLSLVSRKIGGPIYNFADNDHEISTATEPRVDKRSIQRAIGDSPKIAQIMSYLKLFIHMNGCL